MSNLINQISNYINNFSIADKKMYVRGQLSDSAYNYMSRVENVFFCDEFDSEIDFTRIPPNVEMLDFNKTFDQPLNNLPRTVKLVRLYRKYYSKHQLPPHCVKIIY
jgi:hypothetical protein